MSHIRTTRDGPVFWILLDRPEKLNAFVGSMREDLLAELTTARDDPDLRVVVITGAGRAFCAGGDVRYMHELRQRGDTADFARILDAANAVVRMLDGYPKPTIAAVNGIAAGGGANLALACDLRIGTARAAFQQSFIRIGLGPDWGGSFLLPRIVGPDRARELLLTARRVDAEEAAGLGLLHELVEPDALKTRVETLAAELSSRSPTAILAVKGALKAAPGVALDVALEYERSAQMRCFLSVEAGRAFEAFGG